MTHYTQTRTAPATAHMAPSKQTPRLSEAELSMAWPALVAKEMAKKNGEREPRDINKRRRALLEFIASRDESGTADLYRLHQITESQARHDADKLAAVGFIKSKMRGRRLVYQITPEGNAWLETAEAGARLTKKEDATT